jgi:WD40 repeat protein
VLGATVAAACTETVGTVIGSYKLVEQIGEGGMGVVWMAEQKEPIHRRVAVKVIKAGIDSRQILARFEAERQALALMDHPNIARVLDAGTTDVGRPYFVMELVKGTPVTQYCDDKQLCVRERLALFGDVCRAVQHAHQKGVIHRDLKPSNILVAPFDPGAPGVVKVIDFGVAKATGQGLTEATLFTGFGAVIGTLEYMSPEQAEINQPDIDTRSDIYSLGVLMYELLTGSPPFTRTELENAGMLEMLRVIREKEPSKPSTKLSMAEGLPSLAANRGTEPAKLTKLVRGELDWIVMKCLEKDRNRRYETANSLAMDIHRYLCNEPVQACPPSARYRLHKFVRRNWAGLIAAGLVLFALVLGIVGASIGMMRATQERAVARQERDDKETALNHLVTEKARTQAALDQSRLLSGELAFDKGQLLGESGDPNLALLWLARSLKLTPPNALQLQAAIRTNLGAWEPQVNGLRMVLPREGGVFAVAFAPKGRIMTASWKPDSRTVTVERFDLSTGRSDATQTFTGELAYSSDGFDPLFAFSPTADYFLVGFTDGVVQLKDLTTGRSLWDLNEKGGQAVSAAFSPNGDSVLIGYALGPPGAPRQTGKAQLFAVRTGTPLGPSLNHRRPVCAAAFHPDSKSFVTECGIWGNGTEQVEARFWDLTGNNIREPLQQPCQALSVAFSPDGTKLFTGHWDYQARLWNLAVPNEPLMLQHGGPVTCVAFSPDGQTLLTGTANCLVYLWNVSGKSLGPPLRQGHQVQAATFSADNTSILIGTRGKSARLWDLATTGEPPEPKHRAFFPLAFSSDQQTILTRDEDYTVQLRDAATSQPVGVPMRHQRPVSITGGSVPVGQPHACSSDRCRVLTVDEENVARLWDAQTGQLVSPIRPLPEATIFAAAFSPDSKVIVTGDFMWTAHVWDAATGKHIRKLQHEADGPIFRLTFRPNGKMLLTGGADGAARFWDSDTGEPIGRPLLHYSAVLALAFAPNGELALTGDVEQNVQIWNVATRARVLSLAGHRMYVNDAVFSPDGQFVVTGSGDRTARLWDVATGKPIGQPLHHPGEVVRVAFTHDGKTILTAGDDDIERSWQVPTAMNGSSEEVELWSQVTTGLELDSDGSVRILDAADWQERRQELKSRLQGR